MNINEARAVDLTDTAGAALLLNCSVETIRQLTLKKQLRCFYFVNGVLVERSREVKTGGKNTLFLREDVLALPPRRWGWPAGKSRKKVTPQEMHATDVQAVESISAAPGVSENFQDTAVGHVITHSCGHTDTLNHDDTPENIQSYREMACLECFKRDDPDGYAAMQKSMAEYIEQNIQRLLEK